MSTLHTPGPRPFSPGLILSNTIEFTDLVKEECRRAKLDPEQVIPQAAWDKLRGIAEAVENVMRSHGEFTTENAKAIADSINLRLLGKPEKKNGHFILLHSIDLGIPGMPPGSLMFTVIPPGHMAPKHMHRSPTPIEESPRLPGEITSSWIGRLEYPFEGVMKVHTPQDRPRISEPDSIDDYPQQKELWVGVFVQFAGCELLLLAAPPGATLGNAPLPRTDW